MDTPAAATTDGAYVLAGAGAKPDVRLNREQPVGSDQFTGPWIGPWPHNLTRFTFDFGYRVVTFRLRFASGPDMRRYRQVPGGFTGDFIFIHLEDGVGPWPFDREVFVEWGQRGGVLGYVSDQVLRCRFDPQLEESTNSIVLRVPSKCFPPRLERLRAKANVGGSRPGVQARWYGGDTTEGWTRYARRGEVVALRDPKR